MGLLRAVHARDVYKQRLMHPDERVEIATARLVVAENLQESGALASEGRAGSTVTMCFSPRSILFWGLRLKGRAYDIRQVRDVRRFGDGQVEFVIAHRTQTLRRYTLRFGSEAQAADVIGRLTELRDQLRSITALTGVDDDGIGRAEWAMVDDLVTAAASPRVKAFGQAAAAWVDKDMNYKGQGLYTYLLTRTACAKVVGDEPTAEDVRALATDIHDYCVARNPITDDDAIYGNILVAFDLTTDGSAVRGPQANMARMVIVGSVLTHPGKELDELRPTVARWIQGHADFVRENEF